MNIQDSNSAETGRSYGAAIDLGSNSFHLLLVRQVGASFVVVERLKEKVQLLGGFVDGRITDAAMQRGLACLTRFAQRLQAVSPDRLSMVGTCALRNANNAQEFVAAAAKVLPAPLQIIDGETEAQLIFTGVSHHLGRRGQPRLVIDIGGGSTEFAYGPVGGADWRAEHCVSIDVGCVAITDLFFGGDHDQAAAYAEAREHARQMLQQSLDASLLAETIDNQLPAVLGTSGTVESIEATLKANGWCQDQITLEGLQKLEAAILNDGLLVEAGLPGLSPDRADIFPAGVAILNAVFEVLNIDQLRYVNVTLLQGIVCEKLLMATSHIDLKADSIEQLAGQFGVDPEQARRVASSVRRLFTQAGEALGLSEADGQLLEHAAQLHEIGVSINARHYHRHGGYVIKHSALPGFSETERSMLALLVRGHRRSMPGLAFQAFDPGSAERLLKAVILLRLAVILERSHADAASPEVELVVAGRHLTLGLPTGWLAAHPLSARELEVEAQQLTSAGFSLHLPGAGD